MFVLSSPPSSTVAADVALAVDALVATDPAAVGDDELAAAMVDLRRQQARLSAATAALTAEFDARRVWAADGSRGAAAWIAARVRQPRVDVAAEVRLGRRLRAMPATRAALAAGDIALPHAQRLAGLAAGRTGRRFPEGEDLLVGHARTMRWADFARTCRHWRDTVDPDGPEHDSARDEALRRVHLSPTLDGVGILDGRLTVLGTATVGGALERIEHELYLADLAEARARVGDGATAADLARTPAQRRHDALVEMATRAVAAPADGKRPRPLVSVVVGHETFAGRVCELAAGTVVAPGLAARVLADDRALIETIVFDGARRVTHVSPARSFRGALRRALEVRDRTCTHPTCDVPAARCQGDHVHPWSRGGPTSLDNGQLQCGFHNRWRHRQRPP